MEKLESFNLLNFFLSHLFLPCSHNCSGERISHVDQGQSSSGALDLLLKTWSWSLPSSSVRSFPEISVRRRPTLVACALQPASSFLPSQPDPPKESLSTHCLHFPLLVTPQLLHLIPGPLLYRHFINQVKVSKPRVHFSIPK